MDVSPLTSLTGSGASEYRIIRTNERDEYERGAAPLEAAPGAVVVAAPTGDQFLGSDRKTAKLSVGTKKIKSFGDLKDLLGWLPVDTAMMAHVPPIGTAPTSARMGEEQRRVRVRAFLYAASREADNDFHLIVGRDPSKAPEIYMTMEVSGLPPSTNAALQRLTDARDAYKGFFGAQLPGLTYDFYDPPIGVEIEGSLFFDMSHATGLRPGPKSLKSRMPTIWEVHPITKIVFNP